MSSAADSKRPMPFDGASTSYQQAAPMQAAPQVDDDSVFGPGDEPHGWYASFREGLGNCLGTIGMVPLCCCFPNPYKEVDQGNVGLVTRFGRFNKDCPAGLVRVNPVTEHLEQVSLKVQTLDVDGQDLMTKDNVKVTVSSVIYFKIMDAKTAVFKVERLGDALRDLVTTTLRDTAGRMTLQELVADREAFAKHTQETVESRAKAWGTHIESLLLKDTKVDPALQASLSMAAQSKRTGEAKVIAAQAEVESAKLMRQAADVLNTPAAMQIRYLETMQAMAKSSNSKVIFLPGPTGADEPSGNPTAAVPMIAQQEALTE